VVGNLWRPWSDAARVDGVGGSGYRLWEGRVLLSEVWLSAVCGFKSGWRLAEGWPVVALAAPRRTALWGGVGARTRRHERL